jgi:insulysin
MLCDLFRDSITEKVYDAELAGLQFSIDFNGDHITFGTVGYNDKLAALTESMLKLFMEFKVDPERFSVIKDQVRYFGVN